MGQGFEVDYDFVEDWLCQTCNKSAIPDSKTQATFIHVLEIFEELGPVAGRERLPYTRTKFLFDGIWEIRVGQFRLAYFWYGSKCVLLHGIRKKQNGWSEKDKKIVRKRKAAHVKNWSKAS